jgi:hypothetical protein
MAADAAAADAEMAADADAAAGAKAAAGEAAASAGKRPSRALVEVKKLSYQLMTKKDIEKMSIDELRFSRKEWESKYGHLNRRYNAMEKKADLSDEDKEWKQIAGPLRDIAEKNHKFLRQAALQIPLQSAKKKGTSSIATVKKMSKTLRKAADDADEVVATLEEQQKDHDQIAAAAEDRILKPTEAPPSGALKLHRQGP